jgi:hypothetical protein
MDELAGAMSLSTVKFGDTGELALLTRDPCRGPTRVDANVLKIIRSSGSPCPKKGGQKAPCRIMKPYSRSRSRAGRHSQDRWPQRPGSRAVIGAERIVRVSTRIRR